MARRLALVLLLLVQVALAQSLLPEPVPLPAHPTDFPFAKYRQLVQTGQSLYDIDPGKSWVQIKVYRGGVLARLGHNHVISTQLIHGLLTLGQGSAQADLYIRLEDLVVDLPELRRQAGDEFSSKPSADDIAATRKNMLGERILDAARVPFASLNLNLNEGTGSVKLTIRGGTQTLSIQPPLPTAELAPITGILQLKLSDFGIKPFTTLAGALQVKDDILIEYQLQLRAATLKAG